MVSVTDLVDHLLGMLQKGKSWTRPLSALKPTILIKLLAPAILIIPNLLIYSYILYTFHQQTSGDYCVPNTALAGAEQEMRKVTLSLPLWNLSPLERSSLKHK